MLFVLFICDTYTMLSILMGIIWEILLYLLDSMPMLRNHASKYLDIAMISLIASDVSKCRK